MKNNNQASLCLVVTESSMPHLYLILQQGFMRKAHVGCSLNMFLKEQMGLSPEYIRDNIQTIFLDGKPVDDLDSAIIRDGSHLALSAAMPGLVGAAMRRGGVYSSLRGSITYDEKGHPLVLSEGIVHMKLFNLLMDELGPHVLKEGIIVASSDLADFLSRQSEDFWLGCKSIILNEKPIESDMLFMEHILSRYEMIELSVRIET